MKKHIIDTHKLLTTSDATPSQLSEAIKTLNYLTKQEMLEAFKTLPSWSSAHLESNLDRIDALPDSPAKSVLQLFLSIDCYRMLFNCCLREVTPIQAKSLDQDTLMDTREIVHKSTIRSINLVHQPKTNSDKLKVFSEHSDADLRFIFSRIVKLQQQETGLTNMHGYIASVFLLLCQQDPKKEAAEISESQKRIVSLYCEATKPYLRNEQHTHAAEEHTSLKL